MKTKQSLYDFIDKKVGDQRTELNIQLDALITDHITPILDNWVKTEHLEIQAQNFADSLGLALETYQIVGGWKRQQIIAQINSYVIAIGRQIRDDVFEDMRNCVSSNRHATFHYEPLDNARDHLCSAALPIRKKLDDLKKLQTELRNVISKEHNGEKAYKALIALGVDMRDYEGSNANLPAITKLSVDPCLINGNCG